MASVLRNQLGGSVAGESDELGVDRMINRELTGVTERTMEGSGQRGM